MHAVYYIDFENVNSAGLSGIENLTKKDKVVIFVGNGVDAIRIKVNTLAKMVIKYVPVGKPNALDFQLIAHLAAKSSLHKDYIYKIISSDKGYDYAIYTLHSAGVSNVNRYVTIADALSDTKAEPSVCSDQVIKVRAEEPKKRGNSKNKYKKETLYEYLCSCGVDGLNKSLYGSIKACVEKSSNSSEFRAQLIKAFGSKKGLKFYRTLHYDEIKLL